MGQDYDKGFRIQAFSSWCSHFRSRGERKTGAKASFVLEDDGVRRTSSQSKHPASVTAQKRTAQCKVRPREAGIQDTANSGRLCHPLYIGLN